MVGAAVYTLFFLLAFLASFIIPQLPPASLLHMWFEIQGVYAPYIDAIINGVVTGFAVWSIFSFGRTYSKKRIRVAVLLECPSCKTQWQKPITKAHLQYIGFPKARTLSRHHCGKCGRFIRPKIVSSARGEFILLNQKSKKRSNKRKMSSRKRKGKIGQGKSKEETMAEALEAFRADALNDEQKLEMINKIISEYSIENED